MIGAAACGPGAWMWMAHHHRHGRVGMRGRPWWAGAMDEPTPRAERGEIRYLVLDAIRERPRHGYEVIQHIEERAGGTYRPSPGVIYPTLTLLQDMGRIEEATAAGPRKAFAVTADGTAELLAKKQEVEALFARLAELASMRERTDGGPVRRAMGNLRAVLADRLDREGVQTETLHEVAAILDEAARKIERL